MKETVQEFWRARNSRERWVIVIASGLLLIALLDTLLWQPLLKSRDRLRRSVPELRLSAEQVKTQSALAQQLKARAGANTAQTSDLSQALSQAATAAGLSKNLSEVRSTDPNRVSVTLESVGFDAWINLLSTLQMQYGAKLESGQLEALPEPGLVKVRAVLAAAK
jgi:type II secretory pathway component PulM